MGPEGAEPLEWKRPSELVDDPRLFVEGAKRSDINQVPSDFHSSTYQTKLINEKAIKMSFSYEFAIGLFINYVTQLMGISKKNSVTPYAQKVQLPSSSSVR